MSRTFTLARLMAGITILCLVCGLIVNFPVSTIVCCYFLIPPILVWWLVRRLTHYKLLAIIAALISGMAGVYSTDPITPALCMLPFAGLVALVKHDMET